MQGIPVTCGSILPKVGTILPEVGMILPKVGTILPEVGTILPESGRVLTEGRFHLIEVRILPDKVSSFLIETGIVPIEAGNMQNNLSIEPNETSV